MTHRTPFALDEDTIRKTQNPFRPMEGLVS
jgi:hypothetical protein